MWAPSPLKPCFFFVSSPTFLLLLKPSTFPNPLILHLHPCSLHLSSHHLYCVPQKNPNQTSNLNPTSWANLTDLSISLWRHPRLQVPSFFSMQKRELQSQTSVYGLYQPWKSSGTTPTSVPTLHICQWWEESECWEATGSWSHLVKLAPFVTWWSFVFHANNSLGSAKPQNPSLVGSERK